MQQKAEKMITEVDISTAWQLLQAGSVLIDVRAAEQWQSGMPEPASGISRALLKSEIPKRYPDKHQPLLVICAQGKQSLLAAEDIKSFGYFNVQSVQGGFAAWQAAGLPIGLPVDSTLSASQQERYARHLTLPEIGLDGQQKLLESKVLLIGAGGLGSPAALYLTAAGIGTLAIVDDDRVERSNLQRQVLHSEDTCGSKKIDSAQRRLHALNSDTRVIAIDQRLSAANACDLIAAYDVIIDGSDNFATRYAVNQACVAADKPMVYAAVEGFQAQLSVFWPGNDRQRHLPCYHCLFPQPGDGPGCVEAGVLGVVPGIAGMLQAAEALKLCLGIGQPMVGRLMRIDTLSMRITESQIQADPDCPVCSESQKYVIMHR